MNYRSESLKIIQSVFELACGHPKAREDANFERKKIEKQKCISLKKIIKYIKINLFLEYFKVNLCTFKIKNIKRTCFQR